MDPINGLEAGELLQAQFHLYKHMFNFINSMSLKCAVQLGIPDIVHNHGQPITLHELVLALRLHPNKTTCAHRLMRLLVHSGFFTTTLQKNQEAYTLTPSSRLLLKDNITSMSPSVLLTLEPAAVTPWLFLGDWFRGNELSAFDREHGMGFWDYCDQNHEFNDIFHEAMVSDSHGMCLVVKDCKPIFEGLSSLVDVGGGTGTVARIISETFPHLKCIVFDLPHVVADLPETNNLTYVGGDMFQSIPSAHACLIKCVLHDWSDEECVKILKRCREAIPSKSEGGKVIIIEIIINDKKDDRESTEQKILYDMMMMVLCGGRERNEKEWEKIFLEAGFSHYKVTPIFGLRSLIEVYP